MSTWSFPRITVVLILILAIWILIVMVILHWDDQSIFPITKNIKCLSDEFENMSIGTLSFNHQFKLNWLLNRHQNQILLLSTFNVSEKPKTVGEDKIIDQIRFVPPDLIQRTLNGTRLKKILLYNSIYGFPDEYARSGRFVFLYYKCPVNTCTITCSKEEMTNVDAVIFKDTAVNLQLKNRPQNQLWIAYTLESPYHSGLTTNHKKMFNWTSTYRLDSDVPVLYGKFVVYDPNVKTLPLERNFAENKTKKVSWVVSNCWAKNNRLEYAKELSKFIDVDIYGRCGTKTCSQKESDDCFQRIGRQYKFYLAFENSNCKDYITEKFFHKALSNNLLPVVMGAPKEDYIKAGPYNSFIHVDDFRSVGELAEYLHVLDQNDDLYNEYFRWKGTGEFINDYYFCRLCAMLHDKQKTNKIYDDFNSWWKKPGICTKGSWKDANLVF